MTLATRPPCEIDGKDPAICELLTRSKGSIVDCQRYFKWQPQIDARRRDLAGEFLEIQANGNERDVEAEYRNRIDALLLVPRMFGGLQLVAHTEFGEADCDARQKLCRRPAERIGNLERVTQEAAS